MEARDVVLDSQAAPKPVAELRRKSLRSIGAPLWDRIRLSRGCGYDSVTSCVGFVVWVMRAVCIQLSGGGFDEVDE